MQKPNCHFEPDSHQAPPKPQKPRKKRGKFSRFFRGYLMTAGALTTLYVLAQLFVLLLVEIARWSA